MFKVDFDRPVGGKTTTFIAACATAFLISSTVAADDIYSIYLVRHAEKEASNHEEKNPDLTPCGVQRAHRLNVILKSIKLDAIYSSDYLRTRETAAPVAKEKRLDVKLYDPGTLGQFAEELLTERRNSLVVGHSDTTGVLAGMLAGVEIDEFSETEYDRLYQVIISSDAIKLSLLHQAFKCEKGPI